MSAPAQKPRPAPVTTNAPTDGSSLPARTAWVSSACIRGVHAFSFSGRFSVSTRTSSRSVTVICSYSDSLISMLPGSQDRPTSMAGANTELLRLRAGSSSQPSHCGLAQQPAVTLRPWLKQPAVTLRPGSSSQPSHCGLAQAASLTLRPGSSSPVRASAVLELAFGAVVAVGAPTAERARRGFEAAGGCGLGDPIPGAAVLVDRR